MKTNRLQFHHLVAILMAIVLHVPAIGQNKTLITIRADKPIAAVQPTMWGIFFEDINMGADGGLYAELVMNRSFEFYKPMMGWTVQPVGNMPFAPFQKQFTEGTVIVVNRQEKNTANPRFIRITAKNS